MAKKQKLPVDARQRAISGYRLGMYWFGCNGRTINGLGSDSFRDEADLLDYYDRVFGQRGFAGGLIRVYEDGGDLRLRADYSAQEGLVTVC